MTILLLHKPYLNSKSDHEGGRRGSRIPKILTTSIFKRKILPLHIRVLQLEPIFIKFCANSTFYSRKLMIMCNGTCKSRSSRTRACVLDRISNCHTIQLSLYFRKWSVVLKNQQMIKMKQICPICLIILFSFLKSSTSPSNHFHISKIRQHLVPQTILYNRVSE